LNFGLCPFAGKFIFNSNLIVEFQQDEKQINLWISKAPKNKVAV